MKTLGLHRLCRAAAGILSHQEIHTSSGLLARGRVKVPRVPDHEPGTKFRNFALEENELSAKLPEDIEGEGDYEDDFDLLNADKAYDEHKREKVRNKRLLEQIITKKRFFAPRPQPQTLTSHERECIKYLHKQDPVQWDVKTLAESFPATPEVISKILKSKRKITPERAKTLDSKVQKNWTLLKDGKLDADPHVLNHLKKFINRREVLLEQIKKEDFYLPEVKKEPVWNNGEFSSILGYYEKEVKKLEQTSGQQSNLLADGISKKESAVDYLHKKITQVGSTKEFDKDSFMVGGVINAYGREMTLEEVEEKVLRRKEAGRPLGVFDKAILETKLGGGSPENLKELPKGSSPTGGDGEKVTQNRLIKQTGRVKKQADRQSDRRAASSDKINSEVCANGEEGLADVSEGTQIVHMENIEKVLNKLNGKSQSQEEEQKKEKKVKPENVNPVSLALEEAFYNREVEHIRNTSFWNNSRCSKEKALAEMEKLENDALAHNPSEAVNEANYPVFSTQPYPERIKIPKGSRGSGLTFRVKDCYYDDDGMFLYKVPGMTKC